MKKPRIFIGSSVEGLDIAYAIQENLDHNAYVTIWDQGIFNLTSNALDDLISTLKNTDLGIFVFSPDDITKIRDNKYKTTRDNVIFELGLFIGYLGKTRVSFVIPRNVQNFHLPSDLTGITPGEFNPERPDNNLRAALGPFCNKIKVIIKKIAILDLAEFQNENQRIKDIVINKPDSWEFILTLELLKSKIVELNKDIYELDNNLYITPTRKMSGIEYINWISELSENFLQLLDVFKNNYLLIQKAWGEPGQSGDELEIKQVLDRMIFISKQAIELDKSIKGAIPPTAFEDLKGYLTGWSKSITNSVFEFYYKLDEYFSNGMPPDEVLDFKIKIESPDNVAEFSQRIEYYRSILPNILDEI